MIKGVTVITAATRDPVSLQEAKAHCRVDAAEDDGILVSYLLAARSHLETLTGRVFAPQTLEFSTNSFQNADGEDVISLPVAPVRSVTSIAYIDQAGNAQTLSGAAYEANLSKEPVKLEPAYNGSFPTARDTYNAVTVRFEAGYPLGNLPEPLRVAILLLVGHWYANREAVTTAQNPVSIPFGVDALIANWRL